MSNLRVAHVALWPFLGPRLDVETEICCHLVLAKGYILHYSILSVCLKGILGEVLLDRSAGVQGSCTDKT